MHLSNLCLSSFISNPKTSDPISVLSLSLSLSLSTVEMADSEHSVSNESSVEFQEETSKEIKLEFSEDEEMLIVRMFNLVGERWSLIAGRIPGRTAEEIEKYWTTTYSTNE